MSELEHVIPFDLETSGLDEQCDQILEAHARGGVITGGRFVEDRRLTVVFPIVTDVLDWHPAVVEMHSKNGLLAEAHKLLQEVKKATPSDRSLRAAVLDKFEAADSALAKMFPKLEGDAKWTLLGNSVHFDLRFVRRCFPKFARNLSHRVIDVSSIRIFTEALGLPYTKDEPAHRATEDVDYSIKSFERYAAWAARAVAQ